MDPRIPDGLEAFALVLKGGEDARRVERYVDGTRATPVLRFIVK